MIPTADRLQLSARDLRQSRFRRDPVPLLAGDEGDQARAGRGGLEAGAGQRDRSRGAGALHADPLGRDVGEAVGALHQHPPFVPAGLQGRAALPPGPRARRQADRRHRALRHRAISTKARSSSRTSSASAIATRRTISRARAATSNAACWRAPCAIISKIA